MLPSPKTVNYSIQMKSPIRVEDLHTPSQTVSQTLIQTNTRLLIATTTPLRLNIRPVAMLNTLDNQRTIASDG